MPFFIAVLIAVGLLVLITVLALSKKSSPSVRRAAVIALVLIALSVIASLILIFSASTEAVGRTVTELPPEPVQPRKEGALAILLFTLGILSFFTLAALFARRREQGKSRERAAGK